VGPTPPGRPDQVLGALPAAERSEIDRRGLYTAAHVAAATAALDADFAVVGFAAAFGGFLALVAHELAWPPLAVCYWADHAQIAKVPRPGRADLAPAVVAAIEASLAMERRVYDHAAALCAL
jgi:hypothetical protein